MAKNGKAERTQGVPSLTARSNWGKYLAGMATEVLFVFALIAAGVVLAIVALVIWP